MSIRRRQRQEGMKHDPTSATPPPNSLGTAQAHRESELWVLMEKKEEENGLKGGRIPGESLQSCPVEIWLKSPLLVRGWCATPQ
mmetsp:Transcript_23399/g.47288  ORF Transcript_23399/g.47288 Transcript_23399/m.47288 type:complete len:84 (-) Transcript_23399:58-309(-)